MAKNYIGSRWPHEIRTILTWDATDNPLLLDLCIHNSMYILTKKLKMMGKKVGQRCGKV